MAITIEGYTVVAQRARIQHLLDSEQIPFPNATALADDDLWRCSFMAHQDALNFIESLNQLEVNTSQGPDSDLVLVNEFDQSVDPYCEWLMIAVWEKAVIAWLVGTDPRTVVAREGWDPKVGSGLIFADRKDPNGLELLRVEGNVEVFLDKNTGKEVYIGRTSAPIESMFKSASGVIQSNWRAAGQSPVTGEAAAQVADALEMLKKVVEGAPNDWAVHWIQGKGYLALGDLQSAYSSFERAFELEKNEQAIPRELGGVCLELGNFKRAVEVTERAVALVPDSHELLGNLAISHLFAGNLEAAQKTIAAAMKIKAVDTTNSFIGTLIADVAAGKRPQPRSTADLRTKPKRVSAPVPASTSQPIPVSAAKRKPFWQFWKK